MKLEAGRSYRVQNKHDDGDVFDVCIIETHGKNILATIDGNRHYISGFNWAYRVIEEVQ